MNDDNENVLIIAYNLFCTILIPAVIVLIGIWSLESESDFTHGRTGGLPMGALTVFVPEVILGYKCTNYILWNGVHCAVWINVEYSHGIEAGIKRIPFGVSTGILACSVF